MSRRNWLASQWAVKRRVCGPLCPAPQPEFLTLQLNTSKTWEAEGEDKTNDWDLGRFDFYIEDRFADFSNCYFLALAQCQALL